MDPSVRRLAVPTEDHPVEYLRFQGDIPEGNYGAGRHRIWDGGTYALLERVDPEEQIEKGKLKLELRGGKLKGRFNLFRLGARDQWLLAKSKGEHARSGWKRELLLPDETGTNSSWTSRPAGNPPTPIRETAGIRPGRSDAKRPT